MTPLSIAFLIVSMGVLWGGLVWSLLRLRRHPEIVDEDQDAPPST